MQKHAVVLLKVIHLYDSYLYRHSCMVAEYSLAIGKEMSFSLYMAGLLHDIGKIGMKEILSKAGQVE